MLNRRMLFKAIAAVGFGSVFKPKAGEVAALSHGLRLNELSSSLQLKQSSVQEDKGLLSDLLAIERLEDLQSFTPIHSILKESLDLIDKRSKRKEHTTGVPTGFYDLDDITDGFQPSDLVVIAGRPGMGKTSLALGVATHAAIHAGTVVAIFSLEMSKPQIVLRMLSSEARVDSHGLRPGTLQNDDWWRLAEAARRLEQAPIFIDDTGGITVQQMRGKARRLKAERGLGLLIVDYLQLMRGRSGSESRQQEISDISRSLKALAKELNVPVVALSQLSRAVEDRKPPIPMLADLRESGEIEQVADVVMFIYREDLYDENSERKGLADILVSKHRNGPTGRKELFFHDRFVKFESLDNQ